MVSEEKLARNMQKIVLLASLCQSVEYLYFCENQPCKLPLGLEKQFGASQKELIALL